MLHSGHTINEEESRVEVNNKMKHTIKVAWAKGFSQFLALAGAILLVFVLFKFDAIMAQIMRIINILMRW